MNETQSFRWSQVEPICVLRRLLRQIPILLAGGAIGVMCAWIALTSLYHPVYTAQTTLAVNIQSSSYSTILSNLSRSSEIAETFTQLFESNVFGTLAAEQLGVSKLPGSLTASVVPETNLVVLQVTADSPEDAFRTLRLVLDNYDQVSTQVFQNVILRQLDRPEMPVAPSNPLNTGRTLKLAGAAGVAVVAALVLLLTLWSDTVQTAEGLRRKLDLKLFGVLDHEAKNKTLRTRLRRANKGLLVTMPVASFRFTESVDKLSIKLLYAMRHNHCKVFLITSVAENEGKSTVAANLALALAQRGRKVLLIDADLHKAAQYKLLQHEPRQELSSVLEGKEAWLPEYLEREQLYVTLSRQSSREAAELIASPAMAQLLQQARAEMDVILLDTPPIALFSDVEVLADQADASLLVVRQDRVSARRINDAADTLRECRAQLLGCIFNDVRSTPFLGGERRHLNYGYGYEYGYDTNPEPVRHSPAAGRDGSQDTENRHGRT